MNLVMFKTVGDYLLPRLYFVKFQIFTPLEHNQLYFQSDFSAVEIVSFFIYLFF